MPVTIAELLRLLEILAWPAVAVSGILVVRPHLRAILSGAKIKLSASGIAIETTLPELKQILEEQLSEPLSSDHIAYLTSLHREGTKQYPSGVASSDERKFLRPLRNTGLILTVPRNAFLQDARAIELSGLGRLFLRAIGTDAKSGT